MKAVKKTDAKKTPGTLAVEKHRPLMNKLTVARRQHLRQRAAELLYGHEARFVVRQKRGNPARGRKLLAEIRHRIAHVPK